jgi:hypothetical protein
MTPTRDRSTSHDSLGATESLASDVAAGLVSGIIATLAMSIVMQLGQRAGLLGVQPPRKVSDAVLDRAVGVRVDERTRRIGTAVVHLGIGAGAGAVQQVVRRRLSWPEPRFVWGAVAGGLLWTVNYFVLAPLAGILPPPPDDRPGRPPVMLAANVLWGSISALLGDWLRRSLAAAPTATTAVGVPRVPQR